MDDQNLQGNRPTMSLEAVAMSSSKPAWRHHYVPQFYLKQWCDSSGLLWVYQREPSGRISEKHYPPRSVGFEKDLYAVQTPVSWWTSWAPDDIEKKFLAQLDDQAAQVLKKLLSSSQSGPEISTDEQLAWARFLHSLVLRAPAQLHQWDEHAVEVGNEIAERWLARTPEGEDLDRLRRTFSEIDLPGMARNAAREGIVRELRASDALNTLAGMKWTICRTAPDTQLIATDSPLVIYRDESTQRFLMLALALNPSCLFVAHDPASQFDEEHYARAAFMHNLALLGNPCKYVFSATKIEDGSVVRLRRAVEETLAAQAKDDLSGSGAT